MSYLNFEWNNIPLKIDKMLAEVLASLAYNVEQDWDFVIVITGDRTVRTGKSVLAMTVCAFIAYMLKKLGLNENAFNENNIFFDGSAMMSKVQEFKPYSVVQMDEARESLASSKTMQQTQQNILDFFAECGQLKNIFVLVLPDYFELKEIISVARSEILINVSRETAIVHKDFMGDGIKRPIVMFKRGTFKLYNRESKSMMYDLFRTSRQKNYNCVRPSFPPGSFENQYPIDEKKYREMKAAALARFKERHNKENQKDSKLKEQLIRAYQVIEKTNPNMQKKEIASLLGVTKEAYGMFKSRNFKAPLTDQHPEGVFNESIDDKE